MSSTPYLSPQLLINHYSMEHSVTSHSFATYAVKMLQLFMSEHVRWVVAAVYSFCLRPEMPMLGWMSPPRLEPRECFPHFGLYNELTGQFLG